MGCGDGRRAPGVKWGSIVRVNLDPVVGSEANKVRPAVVVCNDRAIAAALTSGRGVITVAPVTSNVSRIYDFQVLITAQVGKAVGLRVPSKVQAEQVRSVDVRRIAGELGVLPENVCADIRRALLLHLDLE